MQRRKFLKKTLSGIAPIIFAPPLLEACKKDSQSITPSKKSVIVIGAGIAGLAAANKLKQKGFNVIVLEAQDKSGGRIRTNRSLSVAFDEGAGWIHGPDGNPITGLAAQAGAKTFLTDDNSVNVFDTNTMSYAYNFLTETENQYKAAITAVKQAGNVSQSFQTVFNTLYPTKLDDRLWKYLLSTDLEFDTGADISKLSSKYFDDDEKFNGSDVIVTNGYDKITQFLAQGLNIKLNTRVTSINYLENKIIASANGNYFETDYVLVTVPLGVLKKNVITFTPVLPADKRDAINDIQMGNVNKFLLIWNTAFWDTSLQYIGYTSDTKGKFNYFLNMKKFIPDNALMTFAFGDYATVTETMSDSQVKDTIMSNLKNIYGSGIPNPSGFLRTKWGQNINTFGSYSFATNGTTTDDFDFLANAVDNKIFFAGEHTERLHRGTVHGAYLSGIREAEKIITL